MAQWVKAPDSPSLTPSIHRLVEGEHERTESRPLTSTCAPTCVCVHTQINAIIFFPQNEPKRLGVLATEEKGEIEQSVRIHLSISQLPSAPAAIMDCVPPNCVSK